MAFLGDNLSDADYQAAQEEILSNLDNDTETNTETEETVVQQEQEVDNFEEETEELPTQTPTINEEELRKQIEKDLKKKYLSQVSMKAKEADRYRQELEVIKNNFDEDSLTTVEKVVEAKLYEQELNRLEKVEFNNFLKLNPEAKQNLADIQEIKNDFPNMSWERAYKNYLIENNPEALLGKKQTPSTLTGTIPKSVSNPAPFEGISDDELRNAAMAEMRGYM